jgi:ribosomal protein L16 Arg81 hydroxylase
MISDLQSLVDPLTEAEFLTLLRERKLTLLPGSGSRRFETLLNWEMLNHLLDGATFPLQHLRVVRESTHIPTSLFIKQGRLVSAALSKLLDQGVSLIFNQLDKHVPALQVLCKNIARDTSEQITAGAIVTSGRGGALECHYDPEDLIILQIAGTKRWQVFGPSVVNPLQGAAAARRPELPPVFDHVLQPGDFLFLPAGQWHHCENGPHRSLHVGIFFDPPSGRDLITPLTSQLLSDEIFRRPLTRHSSPEAVAAHESALKTHLIDAIQALSLAHFLTERAASRFVDGVHLEGRTDQAHKCAGMSRT